MTYFEKLLFLTYVFIRILRSLFYNMAKKTLVLLSLIVLFYFNSIKCEEKPIQDLFSKQALPYFRRKVEEIIDDTSPRNPTDDSQSHLVSFMIDNVREIFRDSYVDTDSDYLTENNDRTLNANHSTIDLKNGMKLVESTPMFRPTVEQKAESNFTDLLLNYRKTKSRFSKTDISVDNNTAITFASSTFINKFDEDAIIRSFIINNTNDMLTFENLPITSMPFLINRKSYGKKFTKEYSKATTNYVPPMRSSKDMLFLGKPEKMELVEHTPDYDNISESMLMFTTEFGNEFKDVKRSCIMCDNVNINGCSSPKNTLIPSMVCSYDESLCYSQHTPFGIVDRGCFSSSHNMTTYVCACNLCNFISISDMPIIFATKRDWIANVYEISHARRLKKSTMKDMTCLRCEVNSTAGGDVVENSNCLEGRISSLPIQECSEGEICAVKAVKEHGYMWRGCVSTPLYNYYVTLCDTDLCNFDQIVSVYDPD